ncbi:MAG: hypothetical protein ACTSRK_21325 [Promethearchaeota archaeon]
MSKKDYTAENYRTKYKMLTIIYTIFLVGGYFSMPLIGCDQRFSWQSYNYSFSSRDYGTSFIPDNARLITITVIAPQPFDWYVRSGGGMAVKSGTAVGILIVPVKVAEGDGASVTLDFYRSSPMYIRFTWYMPQLIFDGILIGATAGLVILRKRRWVVYWEDD